MLTTILIFSIFLSPLTAKMITLQFDLTGDCSTGQYWCLRQKIYEVDWAINDYLGTSFSCGTGQLNTTLTVDEDGDGWFDLNNKENGTHLNVISIFQHDMELKSVITHSCDDNLQEREYYYDNEQRRSDEYYLTTFDSHSSVSNYEKVSADYSPSQPIKYIVGDLYNQGELVDCYPLSVFKSINIC